MAHPSYYTCGVFKHNPAKKSHVSNFLQVEHIQDLKLYLDGNKYFDTKSNKQNYFSTTQFINKKFFK